ncbi:MAG: alpha-amylase family glycosyl hydrolase [Cyclobacteriaceae bacterium]|nr:MAG: alpha-amylase family glycosyl hydrolase [Cyclobacteriaceae bacterium]
MLRFTLILVVLTAISCSRKKEEIPPLPVMKSESKKIIVYQLMTRLFGNKETVNKAYGTLQENGVGKFEDINDQALSSLKELGITHIWYTGVLEHAVLTDYSSFGIPFDDADVVKGRAGSPYAIKDYYDVNPDLARSVPNRMKEFEALIDRTHQHDMKVLIDFVPNHVARAYKSDAKPKGTIDLGEFDDKSVRFKPDNNFYYLPGQSFQVPADYVALGEENEFPTKDGKFEETPAKVTGNDQFTSSPGVNEWFETVKLNYGVDIENGRTKHFDPVPDTWVKMKDILVYWANKKVDGFRCDMAEMVPVEFWHWVIPQVKAVNPEIIFIAEIYNPDAYRNYIDQGRFDYLYDKVLLYDTLRLLVNGQRSTADIDAIQQRLAGITANMLHFLENHDEQRIASRFFAGNPWKAASAMVISATIDQGPVMIYFGQEVGEPGAGTEGFQGDDGRTTIFDYWGVPQHQKWMNGGAFDGALLSDDQKSLRNFYATLLNLAASHPAIVAGEYKDLTAFNIAEKNFNDDVFACVRYTADKKLLIVAGFNSTPRKISVAMPPDVAVKLMLDRNKNYTLKELLWQNEEVEWIENEIRLELPAYGAYVFEIE